MEKKQDKKNDNGTKNSINNVSENTKNENKKNEKKSKEIKLDKEKSKEIKLEQSSSKKEIKEFENKAIKLDSSSSKEIKEFSKRSIKLDKNEPTYVYAIGGLGEVGKNMYVLEQGNEIWIIDSGIKFSNEVFSIEGVIPSFEHLEKNVKKIKGLIITHGHEDHIGAIPHLLNLIDIPKIYSGRLSSSQIWMKIKENGVKKPKIEIINNTSKFKSKKFEFEFFNVNHSIPDSFGVIARTSNGIIVSTGDFKFDLSPVGSRADFLKMAKIGGEGVTLLLSDSTNAQVDRWSASEKLVSKNLNEIIRKLKGRIILATFASNVYRVREVIKIAAKIKRKIVIFGWSMEKTIKIARNIKYINADDNLFISPKEMKNYNDDEIIVLSTGTQGEQTAALSKMANKIHPNIKIKASDTIIFASNPIPGNFIEVEKIINNLLKMKANVITNKTHPGIHASGHGGKTEQLLMLNLIKPKYFFPIHGETMMLQAHVKTAEEFGINKKNSFVLKNGEKLEVLNENVIKSNLVASAKDVFVDGTSLKGQSLKIVTDRKIMSENGFICITVVIDSNTNKMLFNPSITIKGILEDKQAIKYAQEWEKVINDELIDFFEKSKKITFSNLKETIKVLGEDLAFRQLKLKPIVAPVILNVNNVKKNENENIKEENKKDKKDNLLNQKEGKNEKIPNRVNNN